jgi:hypothetical protein
MGVGGHLQLALQRPPRANANRHATIRSPQNLDAVPVRILDDGIPIRNRDRADVELRRIESEEQSQAIVDAGISINDYGEWGVGSDISHALR